MVHFAKYRKCAIPSNILVFNVLHLKNAVLWQMVDENAKLFYCCSTISVSQAVGFGYHHFLYSSLYSGEGVLYLREHTS